MKNIARFIAIPAFLASIILVVGLILPDHYKIQKTVSLNQPPGQVWQLISDFANQSRWRPNVVKSELVRAKTETSQEIWQETYSNGERISFLTDINNRDNHLIRKIETIHGQFSGQWEFSLEGDSGGTELTVVEQGIIVNPFLRVIDRFIIGQDFSLNQYLSFLQDELNANR